MMQSFTTSAYCLGSELVFFPKSAPASNPFVGGDGGGTFFRGFDEGSTFGESCRGAGFSFATFFCGAFAVVVPSSWGIESVMEALGGWAASVGATLLGVGRLSSIGVDLGGGVAARTAVVLGMVKLGCSIKLVMEGEARG